MKGFNRCFLAHAGPIRSYVFRRLADPRNRILPGRRREYVTNLRFLRRLHELQTIGAASNSGPSFFTLLTSRPDAGVVIRASSGAALSSRLREWGIALERIHPVVGRAIIEHHRRPVVYRPHRAFGAHVIIVNVICG